MLLKCRDKKIELGKRTLIMGILNVTPDSFSDGGKYNNIEIAVKQAEKLIKDGADIIDIGGESTRPGHEQISEEEEIARVVPVIEKISSELDTVISIDTYKHKVAEAALKAGAHIVNDIWGLQYDKGEMAALVKKYDVPLIAMHNQNNKVYEEDIILSMRKFFKRTYEIADKYEIDRKKIILDPGIGFGKDINLNLEVLGRMEELRDMGIDNFITFDAHDPRVQNSTPLNGFDNFTTPYQFIKSLLNSEDDLIVDKDHLLVISPDEGALDRAIYFASVLGVDTGMFYKRRDYSTIVNGKNPIVAHEFLGDNIDGKDIIIIDDMISSGGSMLDTARQLKAMNARRVYICCTFGLFTDGLKNFDAAYEHGDFDKVITTNLTYLPPEIYTRPYFVEADMSKFIASLIDFMNHDASLSNVMATTDKIHGIVEAYNSRKDMNEFHF